MPIARKFLGLRQPALQATAGYLLDRYQQGQLAELSGAIVVVPGRRAGRRLLEVLVEQAEKRSVVLSPPEIETVGRLPEQLYEPKFPFATDLVQQLAWAVALRNTDRHLLAPLVPHPPADSDARRWMELGDLLKRQHTELAADCLSFKDVAEKGAQIDGFDEVGRWQALAKVQQEYLKLLDSLNLWDIQTARLVAIEQREFAPTRDIVLVGTADMNRAMREILDQVAERVTALIVAPPEWAERFDPYGCLRPEAWQEVRLDIQPEQIQVAENPADQADAVVRRIARYADRYRADEITIGVPDERIVADLERLLDQCNLPSRWGPGQPLPESGPYRLLAAIADYVERGRYVHFAALVRHPDLFTWLGRQGISGDWLSELDDYYNRHLPSRLGEPWLGEPERCQRVVQVHKAVERLVGSLRDGRQQRAAKWTEPLLQILLDVYGHQPLDPARPAQRVTLRACEQIHRVLRDHDTVPERLSPPLTAAEVLQWTLEQLQGARIPPPADEAAIELLGWLELPLDDAPALIVTSFNEGYVPESVNSDLFLPNTLRSRLKLEDNARRYARDSYALSVLLASREDLTLIVGRRNRDGDPLAPSRLLFATDPETVARRAQVLFQPPPSEMVKPPLAGSLTATRQTHNFPIPLPEPPVEPIGQLRVTQFRSYLACKYRFYLQHVLKLKAVNDEVQELDGATFGTVLHEVVQRFGSGPHCHSTDPEEIRRVLLDHLDQCVEQSFGAAALPPVAVQIEQLRTRLQAFAQHQAEWADQGWRIQYTEVPGPDHQAAVLDVDGQPVALRGRIDRIDYHPENGQWVIFDYKSSDSGKEPRQTHQRREQWIDLQLPLYRHLARSLDVDGPVQLGYILLPKDVSQTRFCLAEWTEQDLAAADEVARQVVRGIRRHEFWPPTEPPPDFSEEFAAICQDGVSEKFDHEKRQST